MIWTKLLEKGWLTAEQCKEAQQISEEKKENFWDILLKKQWLTEAQITQLQNEFEASATVKISAVPHLSETDFYFEEKIEKDLNERATLFLPTTPKENPSEEKTVYLSLNSPDKPTEEYRHTGIQQQFNSQIQTHLMDPNGGPLITPPPVDSQEFKLERLGDYRLEGELGRGGMGVVYRAYHERLAQCYAIKILASGALASKDSIERFHQEAKTNAKLKHKSIVQVFNSGCEREHHYMVMELISGQTLAHKLIADPPNIRDSLILVRNALEALEYAHKQGVVHRDIKLENIFEVGNHEIKLADFGLARDIQLDSQSQRLTHSGTIIGTPSYMPPEQVLGKVQEIDARSDVYSMGVCLYELLTKRCPFLGNSMHEVLIKVLKEEPIPPSQLAPNIHKDIDTIVLRALEKDKANRYPSAKEFLADLELFLNGFPIRSRPNTRLEIALKWVKRHRLLSSLMIFLVFILVSIGVDRIRSRRFNENLLNHHINLLQFQIHADLKHYLTPAETAVSQLQYFLENELVSTKDLTSLMVLLKGILLQAPEFTNVGYGDHRGYFVMSSRSGDKIRYKNVIPGTQKFYSFWRDEPLAPPEPSVEEHFDCRLRPWFQLGEKNSGIFWTDPYVMFTSKQPGITCLTQIRIQGEFRGVIFVDITTKNISRFVSEFDSILEGLLTNPAGDIFAYSKENTVIRENNQKLVLPNIMSVQNNILPKEKIQHFLQELQENKLTESKITDFHLQKKRYLLGMFPFSVKNQQWCFWYVIGESRFLDPPPIDDVTLFITSLMCLGVILMFLHRFYRKQKDLEVGDFSF